MRQAPVLLFLVWAAFGSAECEIPWNLTVRAEDRCAAYERFQRSLQWSEDRAYKTHIELQWEYPGPVTDRLPILTWIERPGTELGWVRLLPGGLFVPCQPVVEPDCRYRVLGTFCLCFGFPVIEYAREAETYPDVHELDHLWWWLRYPQREHWRHVGHVNEKDVFQWALEYLGWWWYGLRDWGRLRQPALAGKIYVGCRLLDATP